MLNLDLCINLNFTSALNCTLQKQQLSERFNVSIKDAATKNDQLAYDSRKASSGRGTSGGGNVDSRPNHAKNSAESGKIYWISYANLALIFLFPF
ncbi:hypothetical protein L6164_021683 [Bauhinia variegata]|uniref:Uncharacterized protein n=1 Tax=Bauhinia variegata TaxID=167791 RepID=A0ACB9N0T0_BAUVA|nr:hypothetical protein L6164_021683 [Bauhinia variegata]